MTAARNGFPTAKEDATVTVSAGDAPDVVLTAKQPGTPPSVFGDDLVAAAEYGGGEGTAANPYLIISAAELKKLFSESPKNTAGKYYRLDVDIKITAASWIPKDFQGNFDGNGHTVPGKIYVNTDTGFFGIITGGTVSNLTVDADITSTNSMSYWLSVGGIAIAVVSNGKIINCTVKGSVTGKTLENPTMDNMRVGGIVGVVSDGAVVENCTNYALVSGGKSTTPLSDNNFHTGGIAGQASGLVTGCINNGTVIGGMPKNVTGEQYTGGIVGNLAKGGAVHRCLNNGDVVGGTGKDIRTGGIVGCVVKENDSPKVYSCNTNTGRIDWSPASDDNRVGDGEITECPDNHRPITN